jgi:hypothetical protein
MQKSVTPSIEISRKGRYIETESIYMLLRARSGKGYGSQNGTGDLVVCRKCSKTRFVHNSINSQKFIELYILKWVNSINLKNYICF